MNTLRLLTSWMGAGSAWNPYRPTFVSDYPGVAFTDLSGQPTATLVAGGTWPIEVTCDDATRAQIQADARYPLV